MNPNKDKTVPFIRKKRNRSSKEEWLMDCTVSSGGRRLGNEE